MSRDASISFDFADGTYTFRLGIGQLRELQEKTDAGPEEIYHRLDAGAWRYPYIVETIRLGLIGGGASPDKARSLVRDYVEKRPLLENVRPAMEILAALLVGAPDEPPKKDEGETTSRKDESISPTESSTSETSTEPAP